MKLLNQSNSLHTFKIKKKINKLKVFQIIFVLIFVLVMGGLILEAIIYSNINNKYRQKFRSTTIENSKIYFNTSSLGSADYTVVLENDIGMTSIEWKKFIKDAPKELRYFYYNRAGYGESEPIKKDRTPENEAKELYEVLKKQGYKAPYILVGHGYGGLIMTSFAKNYSDDVGGLVLVDSYSEEQLKSGELKNKTNEKYIIQLEAIIGKIGLNRVIDGFGGIKYPKGLMENLTKEEVSEFRNYRVSRDYCKAYSKELGDFTKSDLSSQGEGILKDKPLFIITSKDGEGLDYQKKLLNMSSKNEFNRLENATYIPIERPDAIYNGIKFVIKKMPKTIEKK